MAANALRCGRECRVRGRATAALSVQNGEAGGERFFGERLEDLRDVDIATTQSSQIGTHRAVDNSGEAFRIDTEIAKVLLQAKPRRRHLAHGAEAKLRQGLQVEPVLWRAADEVKGIAADDLAKAQKVGPTFIAVLHDPHRPAPGDVGPSLENIGRPAAGRCAVDQRHVKPLAREMAERQARIERRVEDGAEVLSKPQPDQGSPPVPVGNDQFRAMELPHQSIAVDRTLQAKAEDQKRRGWSRIGRGVQQRKMARDGETDRRATPLLLHLDAAGLLHDVLPARHVGFDGRKHVVAAAPLGLGNAAADVEEFLSALPDRPAPCTAVARSLARISGGRPFGA